MERRLQLCSGRGPAPVDGCMETHPSQGDASTAERLNNNLDHLIIIDTASVKRCFVQVTNRLTGVKIRICWKDPYGSHKAQQPIGSRKREIGIEQFIMTRGATANFLCACGGHLSLLLSRCLLYIYIFYLLTPASLAHRGMSWAQP